jgi:uncharacterized membrane protein YgcG
MDHVALAYILMGIAVLVVALGLLLKIVMCSKTRVCRRDSDDTSVLLSGQGAVNTDEAGHHHSGHDGSSGHGGDSSSGFDGGGHSGH